LPAGIQSWQQKVDYPSYCVEPGTHIKKPMLASEAVHAKHCERRHHWKEKRQPSMARQRHRLVFIDETSVNTNLSWKPMFRPNRNDLLQIQKTSVYELFKISMMQLHRY